MTWHTIVTALGTLGLAGIALPRVAFFSRRQLPNGFRTKCLARREQPEIVTASLRRGHRSLVILAHGFMDSMSEPGMIGVAETLADRFDVLLFDFPGHGQSAGTARLDFAQAADSLRHVIDYGRSCGYRRIGVVGYSMGGSITAKLLTTYPERFLTATLGAASGRVQADAARGGAAGDAGPRLADGRRRGAVAVAEAAAGGDALAGEEVAGLAGVAVEVGAAEAGAGLAEALLAAQSKRKMWLAWLFTVPIILWMIPEMFKSSFHSGEEIRFPRP